MGSKNRKAATAERPVAAFAFIDPSSVGFADTFSRKGEEIRDWISPAAKSGDAR
ncbi:hypothetical protein BH10PSE3_BH10PSE3_15900 [soil metagenome]